MQRPSLTARHGDDGSSARDPATDPASHTARATANLPASLHFVQGGWLSANFFVISGDKPMMIDCGHASMVGQTREALERATSLRFEHIDTLVLTHPHSDHAGGAHALQEAGATVRAHRETMRRVNAWDERSLWVSYAKQEHRRFTVREPLQEGEELDCGGWTLRVLHTPGHAGGMVALYCPEHRTLLSADVLWENGFGPLIPFTEGMDVIADQRASLEVLGTLDVEVVLPGHGPAFSDFEGARKRALSRLDAYEDDPRRMARASCKAILIHHLYEARGHAEADLVPYLARVPCIRDFAGAFFAGSSAESLAELVVGEAL